MHDELLVTLPDENEQRAFGERLALSCHNKSAIIYLQGDLGAGKTTLARGFLHKLGIKDKIKSPTYTLIETYEIGQLKILHIDLYRIEHPEEVYGLGLQDQLDENTIVLIEWPEKALTELPPPDITCNIAPFGKGRLCKVSAQSEKGQEILTALCKSV